MSKFEISWEKMRKEERKRFRFTRSLRPTSTTSKAKGLHFFIFIYFFFNLIDNMLQGSPNLYWDFRSLKNISYQLT